MTDEELIAKATAIADLRVLRAGSALRSDNWEDEMRGVCLRRVSEGFAYDFHKREWVRITPYSRSFRTDAQPDALWTISNN